VVSNLTFRVTYDLQTLNAAAFRVFVHQWKPLFPQVAILVFTSGIVLSAVLLSIYGFSLAQLIRARAMFRSKIGKEVEFTLNDDSITTKMEEDILICAWEQFSKIEIRPRCVLLYMSPGSALVVPTRDLPACAESILLRRAQTCLSGHRSTASAL
jgi:YcxB-like protein